MKTVSKTLIAGAITAALVLPASGAFAGEKTQKAVIGAVIGGLAGAALGDGNKSAIAVGAVAGAAIGASTAKSKNDRYGYNDDRYGRSYQTGYGYQTRPAYNNGYGYNTGYSNGYQARDTYRHDRGHHSGQNRYDARYDQGYRR